MASLKEFSEQIGNLLEEKNKAYGNSVSISGEFLKWLYPNGVSVEQFNNMLTLIRIFDKMKRIATNKDALNENPFLDLIGYSILRLKDLEDKKTDK